MFINIYFAGCVHQNANTLFLANCCCFRYLLVSNYTFLFHKCINRFIGESLTFAKAATFSQFLWSTLLKDFWKSIKKLYFFFIRIHISFSFFQQKQSYMFSFKASFVLSHCVLCAFSCQYTIFLQLITEPTCWTALGLILDTLMKW